MIFSSVQRYNLLLGLNSQPGNKYFGSALEVYLFHPGFPQICSKIRIIQSKTKGAASPLHLPRSASHYIPELCSAWGQALLHLWGIPGWKGKAVPAALCFPMGFYRKVKAVPRAKGVSTALIPMLTLILRKAPCKPHLPWGHILSSVSTQLLL